MYNIKDKVVLITGGSGGIGAAVVKAFLDEGAKHIAILDISVNDGNELEVELKSKYGEDKVTFYPCDVTTDELVSTYKIVVDQFGYIDVVINAAGIFNDSPNMYLKAIAVNMTALITSSFTAYELMRKDRGGRSGTIVNVSSIAALLQSPTLPVYQATKSAVMQFSQNLGMEPTFTRTGVRVITICFGATDTKMLSADNFDVFDSENREILIKKAAIPLQGVNIAAEGLVTAYKNGDSASIWLVDIGQDAKDITATIKEAYKIMGVELSITE